MKTAAWEPTEKPFRAVCTRRRDRRWTHRSLGTFATLADALSAIHTNYRAGEHYSIDEIDIDNDCWIRRVTI